MEEQIEMLMPVIAALVYSTIFYGKKYLDVENEQSLRETFDASNFLSTQAVGVLIAGLMLFTGQTVSMAGMMELFLLYEGVIMSLDQAVKAVLRGNEKAARRHARDAAEEAAHTSAGVYYEERQRDVLEDEAMEDEEETVEDESRRSFLTDFFSKEGGEEEKAEPTVIDDGSSP